MKSSTILLPVVALLCGCTNINLVKNDPGFKELDRPTRKVYKKTAVFLKSGVDGQIPPQYLKDVSIQEITVNRQARTIEVNFSKHFSYVPFRAKNTAVIHDLYRRSLGWRYRNYRLTLCSLGEPIENLIPNIYRQGGTADNRRKPGAVQERPPAVATNLDRGFQPTAGLTDNVIALWHSHGWYYNNQEGHWSWQRPRLFQTVEDILPMTFTLNYLIPMLENAGATVFTPRERDTQVNEVLIDNDSPMTAGVYSEKTAVDGPVWRTAPDSAFAVGQPPYGPGVNPFLLGTQRVIDADTTASATAEWIPDIPESGWYSVQIAYQSGDSAIHDAHYTVYHQGGKTEFSVNQQIGGGTWIYLGKFQFAAGRHPDSGKVVLTNRSAEAGKIISADAVKFGGGMGDVARAGQISRRPRYLEAARYYLQYAGIHDTLVYNLHADTLDYTDDYQSRGEWVNYLRGAPYGPNRDRSAAGLGIPVDVSLAFHTDAGITANNQAIGTLAIYSYEDTDSSLMFPDGMSRLANRDLADIMQTQIVNDIRLKYDPLWPRRALMNSYYSEAYRPNVPAVLIELLSHQNFSDMRCANDPRFKFDAGRSIYKAILKFIATQYERDYVVQPLPVTHFRTEFYDRSGVILRWRPASDPLEPTAMSTGYIVYSRRGTDAFDNGRPTAQPEYIVNELEPGVVYGFQVRAVNAGGVSFPSEVLTVCRTESDSAAILIINGFDRVAPAVVVNSVGSAGFSDLDNGVADNFDLSYTGKQYDFNPASTFISNIAPGHGASDSDFETRIVRGNTHDFSAVHGAAIRAAGYGFVSVSDEAVMDSLVDPGRYLAVDLILGEERETDWPQDFGNRKYGREFKTFPDRLQSQLSGYLAAGGRLFVSGAHVASDILSSENSVPADKAFIRDRLKFRLLRDRAVRTGGVFSSDTTFAPFAFDFSFNTTFHPDFYTVEAPDALLPIKDQSMVLLRYDENHYGAAVGYKGDYSVVVFGFPFETILEDSDRNAVMAAVLNYLAGDFSTVTALPNGNAKTQ
ncbi:MAG: N-acetylmuramoyl-L-alanine amidase [Candidatus Neomarinimicrobiota bacterium]